MEAQSILWSLYLGGGYVKVCAVVEQTVCSTTVQKNSRASCWAMTNADWTLKLKTKCSLSAQSWTWNMCLAEQYQMVFQIFPCLSVLNCNSLHKTNNPNRGNGSLKRKTLRNHAKKAWVTRQWQWTEDDWGRGHMSNIEQHISIIYCLLNTPYPAKHHSSIFVIIIRYIDTKLLRNPKVTQGKIAQYAQNCSKVAQSVQTKLPRHLQYVQINLNVLPKTPGVTNW